MAAKPEIKTPEKPSEPAKPSGPSPEELLAAARQAEQRAAVAEGRAEYAERVAMDAAARSRMQAAPPQNLPPDPLIRYSTEDITMSPEDKRAHLAAAIDGRARAAAARTEQHFEQRLAQERVAIEAQTAINGVTMRRPELSDPKHSANFAAAMTKAKYEANAQGFEPSPTQLVIAAERAYDDMFGRKTEKPPFTESPSQGALAQQIATEGKPQRSELEQRYKVKPGFIQPMYDISDPDAMNRFNNEYVISRMKPQLDNGLNSDYANLLNAAIEEKG